MIAYIVRLHPKITEFCKILQKHINSAETGKFRGSARNSVVRGKLWSLMMTNLQVGLLHISGSDIVTSFSCVSYCIIVRRKSADY